MPRPLDNAERDIAGVRIATRPSSQGLLRMYDRDKQLLLAQHVSERRPLLHVDNQLLSQYAEVVTFTPTDSRAATDALRANLAPVFLPTGQHFALQPAGRPYIQARYLADVRPKQAGVPYLVDCPDCGVDPHEACLASSAHKRRVTACEQTLATREAAYDADEGYVIYTGRYGLREHRPTAKLHPVGNSLTEA